MARYEINQAFTDNSIADLSWYVKVETGTWHWQYRESNVYNASRKRRGQWTTRRACRRGRMMTRKKRITLMETDMTMAMMMMKKKNNKIKMKIKIKTIDLYDFFMIKLSFFLHCYLSKFMLVFLYYFSFTYGRYSLFYGMRCFFSFSGTSCISHEMNGNNGNYHNKKN